MGGERVAPGALAGSSEVEEEAEVDGSEAMRTGSDRCVQESGAEISVELGSSCCSGCMKGTAWRLE